MAYPREIRWQAAALIASGSTQAEAGKAIDIPLRTVSRWMAGTKFRRLVNRLRDATIQAALSRLTSLAAKAVERIGVLIDAGATDAVKLKASEAILSHMLKVRESVDFEDRILELDKRIDEALHTNPTPLAGQGKEPFDE